MITKDNQKDKHHKKIKEKNKTKQGHGKRTKGQEQGQKNKRTNCLRQGNGEMSKLVLANPIYKICDLLSTNQNSERQKGKKIINREKNSQNPKHNL